MLRTLESGSLHVVICGAMRSGMAATSMHPTAEVHCPTYNIVAATASHSKKDNTSTARI